MLKSPQRMVACGTGVSAPCLFCACFKQFRSTVSWLHVFHFLDFGEWLHTTTKSRCVAFMRNFIMAARRSDGGCVWKRSCVWTCWKRLLS